MLRQVVICLLMSGLLLQTSLALAESQVVIEETIRSPGSVGGSAVIRKGEPQVRIQVRPETRIERKTTITTRGNIEAYTYRPNCEPPCEADRCYPVDHPCYPCNQYQPEPCPRIEERR